MTAVACSIDHPQRPFELMAYPHDLSGVSQQLRDMLRELYCKDTDIDAKTLHPSMQIGHYLRSTYSQLKIFSTSFFEKGGMPLPSEHLLRAYLMTVLTEASDS